MDGIQQILHHFFQSHQVDEFIIGCRGQEVELWGRWLGWRDLQEGLLQLLPQREFSCSLTACRRVIQTHHRHTASKGRALQTGWRGLRKQAKTGRNTWCKYSAPTTIVSQSSVTMYFTFVPMSNTTQYTKSDSSDDLTTKIPATYQRCWLHTHAPGQSTYFIPRTLSLLFACWFSRKSLLWVTVPCSPVVRSVLFKRHQHNGQLSWPEDPSLRLVSLAQNELSIAVTTHSEQSNLCFKFIASVARLSWSNEWWSASSAWAQFVSLSINRLQSFY